MARSWIIAKASGRFARDERAAIAIIAALAIPAVIGSAVLGTEAGLWAFRRQSMQGAADAAAIAAVISKASGAQLVLQGKSMTAAQGFADGVNTVTVRVNSPPLTGLNAGKSGFVEVSISQPQQPLIARFFTGTAVTISARAVAKGYTAGACLLALNKTANSAISVQGSSIVNLSGCDAFSNSNSTSALVVSGSSQLSVSSAYAVGAIPASNNLVATKEIKGAQSAATDPYANASLGSFSGCTQSYTGGTTLNPGVFCTDISITAGTNVTMAPGIYYLDSANLKVSGNATLTGTGVTIVFTSSKGKNYGTISVSSNTNINISAPTSGPTAGIVLFGDRNMTAGTSFKITGGGTQTWTGAIYLPKVALTYSGGATGGTGCTQIIADTITFTGNSNLSMNCEGTGINPIGSQIAVLVE